MEIFSALLNLPRSFIGLASSFLSIPQKICISGKPFGIIIYVKSFWWYSWLPKKKRVRAMTHGNIVLLGKTADELDKLHEFVHIKQFQRMPFIFPFLYFLELIKNGYRMNKYEDEAYRISGSRYEKE